MHLGYVYLCGLALVLSVVLLSKLVVTGSGFISGFNAKTRSNNSEETRKREETEHPDEADDPIHAQSDILSSDILDKIFFKWSEDWIRDGWDEWSDWDEGYIQGPYITPFFFIPKKLK
ncbi:hypothetical protein AOQ84DRAFT_364708 [Glonium stellatum]|uniref:Uncharacterized protein n=1 Tax=Glonium stellatum TaxID=574774 RepID=A0A8E2EZH2_9PEZI|nr:hypothetical protein AOQ84DRAFT_364708 [Glonium stellatum]